MEAIALCGTVWNNGHRHMRALASRARSRWQCRMSVKRVDRIANGLEPGQWQRLTVGNGSKGPREFEWACVELSTPQHDRWRSSLVVSFREKNPLSGPMYSSLLPVARRLPTWLRPLGRVGRWSNVLKRAKERWVWSTMRCDPGKAGIVTSPPVCWLMPF